VLRLRPVRLRYLPTVEMFLGCVLLVLIVRYFLS
jgi:hypothetical protein